MATLWRCFPFDPQAAAGAAFSPQYLATGQTGGRFDLQDHPPVRYLASSPVHALAEIMAAFRGQPLTPAHLRRSGRPLALVEVTTAATLDAQIANCNNPRTLVALGLSPASLAHHDRQVTQKVARDLHVAGHAGLSWWSSLTGAWLSTVLFEDRLQPGDLRYGVPRLVTPQDDEVAEVAAFLMMGSPRKAP